MPTDVHIFAGFFMGFTNKQILTEKSHQFDETFLLLKINQIY